MTNPVLVNDLRKSWFRRRPVHAVALMAILILALTLTAAVGVPAIFGWSGTDYPVWRLPDLLLPIVAPAFAAGAFAKEHEQRTWQDILLTRLTAREIFWGKFLACFLPTIATIMVMFPPYAMILIVTSVRWAQEPGPWIAGVALRFLVSAAFYLSVSMVCSYHSANTRSSLVLGYVCLALYSFVSFVLWRLLINTLFIPELIGGSAGVAPPGFHPFAATNGLLTLSAKEFGFSLPDCIHMTQSFVICVALIGYLLVRVRRQGAPNL